MLHQYEKLIGSVLLQRNEATLDEICEKTKLGKDSAVRAVFWLREKGFAELRESPTVSYELGEEGKQLAKTGFPERILLARISRSQVDLDSLSREEMIGFTWAKKLGWVAIISDNGKKFLRPTDAGMKALSSPYAPEVACKKLAAGEKLSEADKAALDSLASRGAIVSKKEKNDISKVILTPAGKVALSKEDLSSEETNQLTRELIMSGKWKETKLRGYDLNAPVERVYPAKRHPLARAIRQIRQILIELGFEEMEGTLVQPSFWNFDALFQPQDHPARELADTFYVANPQRLETPGGEVEKKVAKAHEKGWLCEWTREIAEQPVLRTHTTSLSSRYLADIGAGKRKQGKYFSVGRVFRNEATDFKHLAEFYQVEGIIVDENAKFGDLIGTIREIYRRLGFEKLRVRPGYFPYTEPSLEIDVFYEPKKEWMELGGAGVFRPEVCKPLWGKYPVLAWGLGLERPVMAATGVNDVRVFQNNNIGWLRETPASKAKIG